MSNRSPVLVATDLTPAAEVALTRAHAHASAMQLPLVVCHVIPDVMRHHPLLPLRGDSDAQTATTFMKRAAELTTEQVRRVTSRSPDDFTVVVEIGDPEDEIVRVAEEQRAGLIVVGAKPREGAARYLGHVAERVSRYAHVPVLVARPHAGTARVLVATDFTENAVPAMEMAAALVKSANVTATLVHVMQLPSSAVAVAGAPFGGLWTAQTQQAVDGLDELGKKTLEGLAKQYGFSAWEQLAGDPGEEIITRATALDTEMIIVASHGRTGLTRLVLGSTSEKVIRGSDCSVLVVRGK